MATDKGTDNVQKSGTETEPNWEEQYKGLQRKYNTERTKRIAAEAKAAHASVDNPSTRTEELLTTVVDVLGKAVPDMSEQLTKVQGDFKTRREREQFAAQRYGQLTEFVETNEIDWDGDERYAEAKRQWDSGQLDAAIATTRQVQSTIKTGAPPDIDAIVEAKVSAKLKELNKVDTGTSTATNPPSDVPSLLKVDIRKMNAAQLREYTDKLDAGYSKLTGGGKL